MVKSKGKHGKFKEVMTGQSMREFREARHLSREDLADLIGVSHTSIKFYEAGKRSNGTAAPIPKTVRLALAAVAGGILDYDGFTAVGPPGFVYSETPIPQGGGEVRSKKQRQKSAAQRALDEAPHFPDVEMPL